MQIRMWEDGKNVFRDLVLSRAHRKRADRKDIELMKNASLNVIRTGEFAWSKIQPQEGVWDLTVSFGRLQKIKAYFRPMTVF